MVSKTSWIVVRHLYAFDPKPWQVVLCKRNMMAEVMPGIRERRFNFTVDVYSGREWSRKGNGQYEYWSDFPPIEQWHSPQNRPPLNIFCVFWLRGGHYAGIQLGRVTLDVLENVLWQIREPYSSGWTTILSKDVGGWLLLPPDECWREGAGEDAIAAETTTRFTY